MAFLHVRGTLAVLVLSSIAFGSAWARPQDSHEADSAAVKKLFADFNEAFNNHDAHAVAMLFTSDADFITVGGAAFHGNAAVEEHLSPLFSQRAKTIHREATVRDIHFLRPDIAMLHSDMVTSGVMGPNGTAVPPVKGFYDWIVVKQDGRWLIASWHESNLTTAQGQAPQPAAH